MIRLSMVVFLICLLVASCSLVTNSEDKRVEFPVHAALTGEAQGSAEGLNIECSIHFLIERLADEERMNDEIFATMGGEASRTALDEQGEGIGFLADAFDSVRITFPNPDEIIISSRIFKPSGESRFWDELLRFEGMALAEGQWAGTWKCFPLDTRGDSVGIVKGTWTIENVD